MIGVSEIREALQDGEISRFPDFVQAVGMALDDLERCRKFILEEVVSRSHLIVTFCDDTNERNWQDKRLYVRDQARVMHGLAIQKLDERP